MSKSNIRSFRYTDDVAKILNDFAGDSMNQKFENLVLFCFQRLEIRKKDLKKIEDQIELKRDTLINLSKRCDDVDRMIRDLEKLKRDIEILARTPSFIAERLKEK